MKEGESEGSEWDGSRIDSQVSERELTRGQREEEEEVNNRPRAKCWGRREGRRTKSRDT